MTLNPGITSLRKINVSRRQYHKQQDLTLSLGPWGAMDNNVARISYTNSGTDTHLNRRSQTLFEVHELCTRVPRLQLNRKAIHEIFGDRDLFSL